MSRCFFCGEFNEVLLDRRLHNSLPRDCGVISLRPCSQCEAWMEQGVVVIGYDESKTDFKDTVKFRVAPHAPDWRSREHDTGVPNFYRSGEFSVVRESAIEGMRDILEDQRPIDAALKHRWLFLPGALMRDLGMVAETETEAAESGV